MPGAGAGGPRAGAWQTAAMQAGLRVHEGGSGEPVLVLLHGLGATGDVWGRWWPLLARLWPGRWLAPDLPGHGGSPPLAAYSFDSLAAEVAGSIPCPPGPGDASHLLVGACTIACDWSRSSHNRSIGAADADLSAAAKLATYSAFHALPRCL